MELIYLSKIQGFEQRVEINFSTDLNISIGLFGLKIEDYEGLDSTKNFFGDKISNITAFIGRNGTGKTTNVCKPIMTSNWLNYEIVIFKNEGRLLVFKNPKLSNDKIENKSKYEHLDTIVSDIIPDGTFQEIYSKSNEELNDLVSLYYSSSYSDSAFSTKSSEDDISTMGLISYEQGLIQGTDKKNVSNIHSYDSFSNFKFKELIKQINFLKSKIGKDFSVDLKFNSKIIVSHLPLKTKVTANQFSGIELFTITNDKVQEILGDGFTDITEFPRAPRIALIVWSFVYNLPDLIKQNYLDFLRRRKISFDAHKIELDDEDSNLEGFIGGLISLLNDNIDLVENQYIRKYNTFTDLTGTSFTIPLELGKEFIEIYTKYLKEKITNYNFKWNISSGEYSYLSFFSRLYGIRNRHKEKHFILVIDEGDTNFHPEWSRLYVKLLIDWIPKILDRAKSIQLILTTHSPYVLSDLPSSNVFKLSKFNEEIVIERSDSNTFGANIHDLLANDFFLENGFMGEFAKGKINGIIQFLTLELNKKEIRAIENKKQLRKLEKFEETKLQYLKEYNEVISENSSNGNENIKTIKNVINLIGEPLVKDKLLQMLNMI